MPVSLSLPLNLNIWGRLKHRLSHNLAVADVDDFQSRQEAAISPPTAYIVNLILSEIKSFHSEHRISRLRSECDEQEFHEISILKFDNRTISTAFRDLLSEISKVYKPIVSGNSEYRAEYREEFDQLGRWEFCDPDWLIENKCIITAHYSLKIGL
jgi:hypothetical protein